MLSRLLNMGGIDIFFEMFSCETGEMKSRQLTLQIEKNVRSRMLLNFDVSLQSQVVFFSVVPRSKAVLF